jgi:hypothetical protein
MHLTISSFACCFLQANLNITSAPILGITDAQVTVDRVKIDDNFGFTVSSVRHALIFVHFHCDGETHNLNSCHFQGQILVLFRSNLNIEESCFQGGSGDFVIFVDNASDFAASMNFISPETESTFRCPSGGPRLFKEDANSGCFVGGSCNGECLVAAEEETCPLVDSPSGAPSSVPTVDPNAPTVSPTTGAPFAPTGSPTSLPPTEVPTPRPRTPSPTRNPTRAPTIRPTVAPTVSPTVSSSPTEVPMTNAPVAVNTPRPNFIKKGCSKKGKGKKRGKGKKGSKGHGKAGGKACGKAGKGGKAGGKGGKGGKGGRKDGYFYRRDLSESHPRQILSASHQDEESLRR